MGSSATTTQNNRPYAPARPMIDQGLSTAQDMFNAGQFQINPYGGQMVASYDPFRAQADAATPGAVSGALGGAGAALGTLQGAMDPSQWQAGLDGVRDNVIADVMPAINATFSSAGRTGSGLHQQQLAKGLSAGLANPYFDAFNTAQNRSLTAAGMVPGINQAAFGALDFMQGTGQRRQDYEQSQIQADVLRDQQQQMAGLNALQDYLALTTGAGSMFGVQRSTTQQNPGLLQILGTGARIGGMML